MAAASASPAAPRIPAIEQALGEPWDAWVARLDAVGARELSHHEIATQLLGMLDGRIPNHAWWAQSIAVTYEQHVGRRLPGQQPDGRFRTSVSKATAMGMQELMDAWAAFADADAGVAELVEGTTAGDDASSVRVSGTDKRITWRTTARDGAGVIVMSEPKAKGASLVVQHNGAPTPEAAAEAKAAWAATIARFLAR